MRSAAPRQMRRRLDEAPRALAQLRREGRHDEPAAPPRFDAAGMQLGLRLIERLDRDAIAAHEGQAAARRSRHDGFDGIDAGELYAAALEHDGVTPGIRRR